MTDPQPEPRPGPLARGHARAVAQLRDEQRYLDWDAKQRLDEAHPLLTDNQRLAAAAYLEAQGATP